MAGAEQALAAIGVLPDVEIDPAMAALQLARLESPGDAWKGAAAHLSGLAREAASIGRVMGGRGGEARIGALAGLLHARHGYRGDDETYDDLANASLITVIQRRRGLPVSLGILWLHCIRAAGWQGHGVDFPGHFLVCLEAEPGAAAARQPRRLLVDPFAQGRTIGNARLLSMLEGNGLAGLGPGNGGPGADAARPGLTRPMATRDVLLRLQRNLVRRRLDAGEIRAALRSLEGMLLIAPDRMANWLDAAELNRLLGRAEKAASCLRRVLELAPDSEAARVARLRLADLPDEEPGDRRDA